MVLIAVIAIGLILSDTFEVALWDGAFPLEVTLVEGEGHAIVAVAAQTLVRHEEAEVLLANPGSPELHLEDVSWTTGQPFTVRVPCSGRSAMISGRELSYSQFKVLLLRVGYADGSSRLLAVTIPDGRRRRTLSVSLP